MPLLPITSSRECDGDALVREGVFAASGDFGLSSHGSGARSLTLRAYELRARYRTVPHGVFAGVTELGAPAPPRLRIGSAHRLVSYPSPDWLHSVCQQLLHDTDILHALAFTSATAVRQRGDRIEIERPGGMDTDPMNCNMRATAAVSAILLACEDTATWRTIVDTFQARWPGVSTSLIDDTLRRLVDAGVITSDLWPHDVRDDSLGHLLTKVPVTHRWHHHLQHLRQLLSRADTHALGSPSRGKTLTAAHEACTRINPVDRPVKVDTFLDARVQLPDTVWRDAAQAATVLWRTGASTDRLAGWHDQFIARYGTHRLVPLVDATDDVTGIGTDLGNNPHTDHTHRDTVVTRLYSDAIAHQRHEVVLDSPTVAAMNTRKPDQLPPAAPEIYAHVLAESHDDRDAGRFFLAITKTAPHSGSARGRFTSLPPPMHPPTDTRAPIVAEIAFLPRAYAAASLVNDTTHAPFRIRLSGPPGRGDIHPQDLALASDGHRLMLWSTQLNRGIIPVHTNAISHQLMPSLAAWLCALGQHPHPPVTGWSWQPVHQAPFLPRVRYGSTILHPATWRLPQELAAAAHRATQWPAELDRWRRITTPAPPAIVVTGDDDRQLPLDLERTDDSDLLRRYVKRGLATITEPAGGPDAVQAVVPGPAGHHGLEVVIPLQRRVPRHTATLRIPPTHQVDREAFFPGSKWLSLSIRAHPTTSDIIISRLSQLAADHNDHWDHWFWLRYHTEALGHHVRVRFHSDPETLATQLLPNLNELCTGLVRDRLSAGCIVEPYEQEVDRYGGADGITHAEHVFWRDSELVAALLRDQPGTNTRIALVAASAATITRDIAGGDTTALQPYRLDRPHRRLQTQLKPLARELDDAPPAHTALWNTWREALTRYARSLAPMRSRDCASSVIHMHANRMMGRNSHERVARALAKDLIARKPH